VVVQLRGSRRRRPLLLGIQPETFAVPLPPTPTLFLNETWCVRELLVEVSCAQTMVFLRPGSRRPCFPAFFFACCFTLTSDSAGTWFLAPALTPSSQASEGCFWCCEACFEPSFPNHPPPACCANDPAYSLRIKEFPQKHRTKYLERPQSSLF